MSLMRVCRGKVRRKIVSFCVLSSLLLFIYVSLKLLTTHETDAVASSRRRFPKRSVRGGGDVNLDENGEVMPPPLQLKVPADASNKTDLNKVILPYKVRRSRGRSSLDVSRVDGFVLAITFVSLFSTVEFPLSCSKRE